MRVTESRLFRTLMYDLNKNRAKLADLQNQVSSGERVRKASDDSLAFTNSRYIEDMIRKNEQYQFTIGEGLRKARASQNALDGMLDRLTELKSIAVEGSNETLKDSDRENLANQVKSIRDSIVGLANSKEGGEYLFAGTENDQQAFTVDTATGNVTYNGNASNLTARIKDDVTVTHSATGNELTNTGEGNLFDIINTLEQDLRNNNPNAVNARIEELDAAVQNTLNISSKIGTVINRMDFVNQQFESLNIDKKGMVSEMVDTDYARAMSDINRFQIAYESALSVHSRITQTNLLDFLR